MTGFDRVKALAAHLLEVAESTSYGTPSLKVRGKSFCRMWGEREYRRDHPGNPAYTGPFHAALAVLYSPQWEAVVEGAKQGQHWAFGPAVDFLEADPQCLRSGYYKERLCRYLSRAPLTPDQRRRLAAVASRVPAEADRPGRERKAWARLSSAVTDHRQTGPEIVR